MASSPSHTAPRVLGVDPGTRITGYAVLSVRGPGRFEYLECGSFRVDGRRKLNERLGELAGALEEVVAEFRPTVLAIESAFHGQNAASALKLAEARGAFKLVALRAGLEIHEYAPSRIKRVVVGKGRATKAEVQRRVRLLCGLTRLPAADAADALAIALCHAHSVRWSGG